MPLIEWDGPILSENIRRVPLADLTNQHRKRYVFQTKEWDIVLKRITQLDIERVALELAEKSKEYLDLVESSVPLAQKAESQEGLTPDEMTDLTKLSQALMPYAKLFSLPCFVDPKIQTIEEFDALLSNLDPDEQKGLQDTLVELSKTRVDGNVSSVGLVLSKEYNIPLSKDLTIENMTAQQASAMTDVLKDQNAELQRLMKTK